VWVVDTEGVVEVGVLFNEGEDAMRTQSSARVNCVDAVAHFVEVTPDHHVRAVSPCIIFIANSLKSLLDGEVRGGVSMAAVLRRGIEGHYSQGARVGGEEGDI
jgi:hypothetical protein